MTMVPLLLISMIRDNSQVSFDRPVKAFRYVLAVADIMSAAKVQFGRLVWGLWQPVVVNYTIGNVLFRIFYTFSPNT